MMKRDLIDMLEDTGEDEDEVTIFNGTPAATPDGNEKLTITDVGIYEDGLTIYVKPKQQ